MKKETITHEKLVLNHLINKELITTYIAYDEYGITRLSATIFNLRKQGYNIISIDRTVTNRYGKKVTYSEYKLKDKY